MVLLDGKPLNAKISIRENPNKDCFYVRRYGDGVVELVLREEGDELRLTSDDPRLRKMSSDLLRILARKIMEAKFEDGGSVEQDLTIFDNLEEYLDYRFGEIPRLRKVENLSAIISGVYMKGKIYMIADRNIPRVHGRWINYRDKEIYAVIPKGKKTYVVFARFNGRIDQKTRRRVFDAIEKRIIGQRFESEKEFAEYVGGSGYNIPKSHLPPDITYAWITNVPVFKGNGFAYTRSRSDGTELYGIIRFGKSYYAVFAKYSKVSNTKEDAIAVARKILGSALYGMTRTPVIVSKN